MLENSMSVQVSSRVDMEETVWFPPGEECTGIGRFRLMFGAVGPPPPFSWVCRYACVGGGSVGACLCSEIKCGCIGSLCYCCIYGIQGMWGMYCGCLGRGLLSVYRSSWVLESQQDHGLGICCSVRLRMGGSFA